MRTISLLSRLACLAILSVLTPLDLSEGRSSTPDCTGPDSNDSAEYLSDCDLAFLTMEEGQSAAANGLIVKFRDTAGEEIRRKTHARNGAKIRKKIRMTNMEVVEPPGGTLLRDAAARYAAEPEVEYAEPNYRLKVYGVPNDGDFARQWNMQNTGQVVMGRVGQAEADIQAVSAWDLTTGTHDVVVAIIDTGVDYTHPDLMENMWKNPGEIPGNGLDDDGNGYVDDVYGIDVQNHDGDPLDDNGHGTHIAGIIGAKGNNGQGVTGVAWDVKIMACKFADALGQGDLADAIECLDYIRMMRNRGVNVVATNNSYGLLLTEPLLSLEDAIIAQNEILFVAAAGNNAYDGMGAFHNYPSDYSLPNIVSVAATDNRDLISGTSNYGHDVHIGAPGVGIWSTFSGRAYNGTPIYYKAMTGTSMAAPHVAGALALINSYQPDLEWWQIRNRVLSSGENVPALAGLTATGKRLNVYRALECADQSVLVPWKASIENTTAALGVPAVLSALSVNCDAPVGPVKVTTSSGETVQLFDNGLYPDALAGDGLFSAEWVPTSIYSSLAFESPAGSAEVLGRYPLIQDADVPSAMMFRDYTVQLAVEGGQVPYFWTVAEGQLPDGLQLDPWTGAIYGVPLNSGSTFSVRVQDRSGHSSVASLSIPVKVLEVLYAGYDEKDKTLHVEVDACRGANDLPFVDGYGPMRYDAGSGFWRMETDKISKKEWPEGITVYSDLGVSAAPVMFVSRK